MIEIFLYTILAIIIIIIIAVLAYYVSEYLDNKKKNEANFDTTAKYINDSLDKVDSNLAVSNATISSNLKNITTNNNIINDNLSNYFSFAQNNVDENNYLLKEHSSYDTDKAKLNILTKVNAVSGLTANNNFKICDDEGSHPNCMTLNIDASKNFNITPADSNMNKLIINSGSTTPVAMASFDLKNNYIYLGADNDSNAAMFIKNNNVYMKTLNLVDGSASGFRYSTIDSNSPVVPFNYEKYNRIMTSVHTLSDNFNKLSTSINTITFTGGYGYGANENPTVTITPATADASNNEIIAATAVCYMMDDPVRTGFKKIKSIVITKAGLNYTTAPTVTISAPANAGKIIYIKLTNTGAGYLKIPTITIKNSGTTIQNLTINSSKSSTGVISISGITDSSNGSYTESNLSVEIEPPTKQATATIAVSNNGAITAITMTEIGAGYVSSGLTITLPSPGTGGSLSTTISNGTITEISVGVAGTGYAAGSLTIPPPNVTGTTAATGIAYVASAPTVVATLNAPITLTNL